MLVIPEDIKADGVRALLALKVESRASAPAIMILFNQIEDGLLPFDEARAFIKDKEKMRMLAEWADKIQDEAVLSAMIKLPQPAPEVAPKEFYWNVDAITQEMFATVTRDPTFLRNIKPYKPSQPASNREFTRAGLQ